MAWREWREEQALATLRLSEIPTAQWGEEVERAFEECAAEADRVADELGIDVEPCLTDDEAEWLLALRIAANMISFPADMAPEDRLALWDEKVELMLETARSIVAGAPLLPEQELLESRERERLAALIERRSRGHASYLELAAKVRATHFTRGPIPRSMTVQQRGPLLFQRRHARRVRRAGGRVARGRGDPRPPRGCCFNPPAVPAGVERDEVAPRTHKDEVSGAGGAS